MLVGDSVGRLGRILGVMTIYVITGLLGLRFAVLHASVTAVWPPTGMALAACLLLGPRIWPGVWLGAFLVNVTITGAVAPSLGIAGGNTLEALVGAWLVTRYAHGRYAFDHAADIFRFTVFGGLLSPMLSATIGVVSLAWGGLARWADAGGIWWTWWLGDAMGALLVTPLVLSWHTRRTEPWHRRRGAEAVVVFLAVVGLGLLVFGGVLPRGAPEPLAFLGVPLLAWMAFRLGQREVTTTVAVLASCALWGTLHGFGPFTRESPHVALLLLQTFMGVTAVTTTIVAAVVAELKQATTTVMQLNQELEQRVETRTAELATANAALRQEITDREHAEAERRRLEREAQRAEHFALLGRLAGGISHEIRNPLAVVFLNVDLLEEELQASSPDHSAQTAESLTEIKTNLHRLEELVQDYLTLVRVAAVVRTEQDLGSAVTAWASEWQQLAAAHHITLQLVGLANLGQVTFHAATLRRALLNLVQNAVEAMPPSETLTVVGQGTATEVHLAVRDTGSGIPAAHLATIFEPLFTTKPGGTGLGLYLVQEIVTVHGGHVTVESVVGQGTTMTVTLPRSGAATA